MDIVSRISLSSSNRSGAYLEDVLIDADRILLYKTAGFYARMELYSISGALLSVTKIRDNIHEIFLTRDGFATVSYERMLSNNVTGRLCFYISGEKQPVKISTLGLAAVAADGTYSIITRQSDIDCIKVYEPDGSVLYEHIMDSRYRAVRHIMHSADMIVVLCKDAHDGEYESRLAPGGKVIYMLVGGTTTYTVAFYYPWLICKASFCGEGGKNIVLNTDSRVTSNDAGCVIYTGNIGCSGVVDKATLIPDWYVLGVSGRYIIATRCGRRLYAGGSANLVSILSNSGQYLAELYNFSNSSIARAFAFENKVAVETNDQMLHVFDTTPSDSVERIAITSTITSFAQ